MAIVHSFDAMTQVSNTEYLTDEDFEKFKVELADLCKRYRIYLQSWNHVSLAVMLSDNPGITPDRIINTDRVASRGYGGENVPVE